MMKLTNHIILVITTLVMTGCSFNFELTSQRTALENQIMGNYREIDDDLIVTNYGKKSASGSRDRDTQIKDSAELDRAKRNRAFNADDINDLKDDAILGESDDGMIKIMPKGTPGITAATPEQIKLAEALIDEENRDRVSIWQNEPSPQNEKDDQEHSTKKKEFHKQVYNESPKGHWFFMGNKWISKQ